jgi:hypothetical protein
MELPMPTTKRLFPLQTIARPYPLRTTKPAPRPGSDARPVTRTGPFSALEEDFFARAADLYPDPADTAEEWERLYAAVKAGL